MTRIALVATWLLACSKPAPRLRWETDEAQAFSRARQDHKPVLIELWASWAMPCIELDRTLATPALASIIATRYVPLKLDVSNDSSLAEKWQNRDAPTLPMIVVVATDGKVLERIDRLVDAEQARAILDKTP